MNFFLVEFIFSCHLFVANLFDLVDFLLLFFKHFEYYRVLININLIIL